MSFLHVQTPVLWLTMTASSMEIQHARTECCLEMTSVLSSTPFSVYLTFLSKRCKKRTTQSNKEQGDTARKKAAKRSDQRHTLKSETSAMAKLVKAT